MFKILSTAAALALSTTATHAATFSFNGTFTNDNDVVIFDFTVGAQSDVTLRSFSYAGGTQGDGTIVAQGGFDPILTLYDATGARIGDQDDGSNIPSDTNTNVSFDVNFTQTLTAGTYSVAVTQFSNFSAGSFLSDGFEFDGAGNETFTSSASFGTCSAGIFCDATDDSRTGAFAFDISGVSGAIIVVDPTPPSPVPLPAGMPLLLAGLGAMAALRHRKPS